jgi:phosphoadenosine phosphosulfate reductase
MNIDDMKTRLAGNSPKEVLERLGELIGEGEVVFASSLGAEDQVITHLIAAAGKKFRIFTLDTGRLYEEAYQLIERTSKRYGTNIEVYFPDRKLVEKMVAEKGINSFYESIEDRKRCCSVRKLEPLKRAVAGAKVWITGLRREQAATRTDVELVEADGANGLIKVNPIYDWSDQRLWEFIRDNDIPYNPLHDKGFPSIGCAPCTRAVKKNEDIRAGRWWWENPEQRECGLHKRDGEYVINPSDSPQEIRSGNSVNPRLPMRPDPATNVNIPEDFRSSRSESRRSRKPD